MFPFDLFRRWSPERARERLKQGNPPRRMRVAGRLDLSNCTWLTELPRVLIADSIDVSNCRNLRALPLRVQCDELRVARTGIARLDRGLEVARLIEATGCRRLQQIDVRRVPELRLRDCEMIADLPEGLVVRRLDLAGCVNVARLPESMASKVWVLDLSGCRELAELPSGLTHLQTLSIRGCTKLTSLPDDIRVHSAIDVAESGLESLPYSLRSTRLLWHGMEVPDRIAFFPESITADEVLLERNAEFRRLLIERMGMERFIAESQAESIDADCDAGGARRLLRVLPRTGEDIVCLEVRCPSTGRRYLLRVPPSTNTCVRAAAWIAGFEHERDYRPFVET